MLVQLDGGSLNLNVHFHTVFLDGVFVRDAERGVAFQAAREPDRAELEAIARRVHRRVTCWLVRRGYVDERKTQEHSDGKDEPTAIEACGEIAMRAGTFAKLAADVHGGGVSDDDARLRFVGKYEGFNLHAGVRIATGDGPRP